MRLRRDIQRNSAQGKSEHRVLLRMRLALFSLRVYMPRRIYFFRSLFVLCKIHGRAFISICSSSFGESPAEERDEDDGKSSRLRFRLDRIFLVLLYVELSISLLEPYYCQWNVNVGYSFTVAVILLCPSFRARIFIYVFCTR